VRGALVEKRRQAVDDLALVLRVLDARKEVLFAFAGGVLQPLDHECGSGSRGTIRQSCAVVSTELESARSTVPMRPGIVPEHLEHYNRLSVSLAPFVVCCV